MTVVLWVACKAEPESAYASLLIVSSLGLCRGRRIQCALCILDFCNAEVASAAKLQAVSHIVDHLLSFRNRVKTTSEVLSAE